MVLTTSIIGSVDAVVIAGPFGQFGRIVRQDRLRDGDSLSCGCARKYEGINNPRYQHGLSHTQEYAAWLHAVQRCFNPSDASYRRYGGRGITVCDRWRDSFENFLADMGMKPSPELELERRDNDGNYEPDNCYWATRIQQQANKRNEARWGWITDGYGSKRLRLDLPVPAGWRKGRIVSQSRVLGRWCV